MEEIIDSMGSWSLKRMDASLKKKCFFLIKLNVFIILKAFQKLKKNLKFKWKCDTDLL